MWLACLKANAASYWWPSAWPLMVGQDSCCMQRHLSGGKAAALPLQISFCICSPLRPFVSPSLDSSNAPKDNASKKELMR